MRRFKKTVLSVALVATALASLTACGKKKEEETTAETTTEAIISAEETITEEETEEPGHENEYKNPLTGEWMDKSFENQRPIAVMINNVRPAIPQSGIGKADIIYECIVEGGITRLMAVFTDYNDIKKLGSLRSARHYYVKLANELDAIYVHAGHSTYAVTEIANSKINHIDAVDGIGGDWTYRTEDRKAPHNTFTDTDRMKKAFERCKYPLTHNEKFDKKKFMFNTEDTEIEDGSPALRIETRFNNDRHPYFVYNSEDKLYYRWQYNDKHIDDQTNEQLKFKNILIQFATYSQLDPKKDLQEIKLVGSGEGLYATDGKIMNITWKKDADSGVTKYYKADGSQLKMNPGKTFITIFKDSNKQGIRVSETTEEATTEAASTEAASTEAAQ